MHDGAHHRRPPRNTPSSRSCRGQDRLLRRRSPVSPKLLIWLFLRFGRLRLTLARKGRMEVDGLYAAIGYNTQAGAIAPATGHFGGAVRNAGRAALDIDARERDEGMIEARCPKTRKRDGWAASLPLGVTLDNRIGMTYECLSIRALRDDRQRFR